MPTTSWTDLCRDGRRLEKLIKHMVKKFELAKNPTLSLAYMDRILKATHEKMLITDRVLGVKSVLKEARTDEMYAQ